MDPIRGSSEREERITDTERIISQAIKSTFVVRADIPVGEETATEKDYTRCPIFSALKVGPVQKEEVRSQKGSVFLRR